MTIDFHTHAFPDELAPHAIETLNARVPPGAEAVLDGTMGQLLDSMDGAGIERSVICSIATAPNQVDPILRWSLQVRSERIVSFGSVHPECEEPAGEVWKIARGGLTGMKLHPLYQGFATDEERMWPIYEAAAEAGLILVLHSGRDIAFPPDDDRAAPGRLLRVHRAFPELRIVAAHLGGWRAWEEVAATLAGTEVYLETSYTFEVAGPELTRAILRRHPVERILFGTDSPWCDQGRAVPLVCRAFPGDAEQEMVLHGNAERLLAQQARRARHSR
ncbi:MAG: amidohydrolase family protein [Planctomycetota bacterium]